MVNVIKQSKYLSLILRHQPQSAGLSLDEHGWVDVQDLLRASKISFEDLETVVRENDKKRFEFNEDKTRIRASQGHSIDVDLNYKPSIPPMYLFHGTVAKNVDKILKNGIKKMKRHAVHLSVDQYTALRVGGRRGKAVALTIDAEKMNDNGYKFFLSTNGVWLTEFVPPEYIKR